MSWGAPEWFWALAILPVLATLFVWAESRGRQLLQRLVAARLQSSLVGNISLAKRRFRFGLMLGAMACLIVAMAEPRYGYTFEQAKRKGRDVMIAIDTSRSMLSTDVLPSRLARAKLAAQDLLNVMEGDRVGLVAFAGSAFVQAPLTVDYSAVLASLNELDTNIIPRGGTDIAEAIRISREAFGKGESESRCLVIFTDGEELDEDAVTAARAAPDSMRIFTVGVGSPNGSLIPVPGENGGTEFVKDPDGNFVKSRLDEAKLKQIAEITGGFYVHLQNGPAEMRRIVEEGLGKLKENEIDARMSRHPIERYQWPLGAGLALLMASLLVKERRRTYLRPTLNVAKPKKAAAVLGLVVLIVLSGSAARAANTVSGEELYKQGKAAEGQGNSEEARSKFEEARKQFEGGLQRQPNSPALRFDKGTADYQLGEYNTAIDEFGKALASRDPKLRAKAEYNLGTALLQRALKRDEEKEERPRKADLGNAIQHFDEAVKLDPKLEDAQYNRKIAKQELVKPKPTPPPSNKDQKDKKDDKDQKKDDKQDQSKDQQSKDQQSKDQQSKEQQSKDQQSKDQQSKDQQSKDQQSKDQQSKDQQSKDQQSKDQQSKDQQSKEQQSGKEQDKKDGNQGQPSPTPTEEKKLSGQIKPSQPEKNPGDKSGEEAQAELETTGTYGEMSPQQARAVLDSLKDEDEHPFKNEQKSAAPVLKDW